MWCLTCSSFAQLDCNSEAHSCIDMSSVSLKNFEALLTLRNDLRKKLEEGQNKLAEAIEKRREVQGYLSQVSKALKLFTTEVDCLEEENNLLLVELISLLEAGTNQDATGLSQLVPLFDDCNSQDPLKTLREKLNLKYRPQYEDKLILAANRSAELEKQKNTKITVSLLEETNISLLDSLKEGFTTDWPLDTPLTSAQRDLLLLSHIIFTINNSNRGTHQQVEIKKAPSTVPAQSLPLAVEKVLTQPTSNNRKVPVNQQQLPTAVPPQPVATPSSSGSIPRVVPSPVVRSPKFLLNIMGCVNHTNWSQQLQIEPPVASPCAKFIKLIRHLCLLKNRSGASFQVTKVSCFQIKFSTIQQQQHRCKISFTIYWFSRLFLGCV